MHRHNPRLAGIVDALTIDVVMTPCVFVEVLNLVLLLKPAIVIAISAFHASITKKIQTHSNDFCHPDSRLGGMVTLITSGLIQNSSSCSSTSLPNLG